MDNVNSNVAYTFEDNATIAWGAIFAGVIISLGSEVLLNFLGIGLGLISFNMDAETLEKLGYGSVIWLIVSGVVSMIIGGYVVGRISQLTCKTKLAYHGLITWSLAMLLALAVTASTIGAVIGGSTVVISNSISSQQREVASDMVNKKVYSGGENSNNYLQGEVANKADEATNAIAKFSFSLFLGFLLSAIAGAFAPLLGLYRRRGTFVS